MERYEDTGKNFANTSQADASVAPNRNSELKQRYIQHVKQNLTHTLNTLNSIEVSSMVSAAQESLRMAKESVMQKLEDLERGSDLPTYTYLLPMLHDTFDEEVKKMKEILPQYSWPQHLQLVLTFKQRDAT